MASDVDPRPGPEPHGRDAVDLPGDEDAARLEVSDGEAAGRRVPVRRARFVHRLRAEVDEEAWASLHSDTSRPFPKPKGGRIAVKVINHLGDEVMKVFKVR